MKLYLFVFLLTISFSACNRAIDEEAILKSINFCKPHKGLERVLLRQSGIDLLFCKDGSGIEINNIK